MAPKDDINPAQAQAEQSKPSVGPASANEPASSQSSERKKQANRENAKQSTGPKTARGKDAVRYNALTHGFYASDVVIRQGDGRESQEEFDILLEGLRRAWEPTDVMQHLLVHTIAEAEWRLRRARRAEVGEIRRQTDSFYARLALDYMDESGVTDGSIWSRPEYKEAACQTTLSLTRKLGVLEEIRKEVEQHGYVADSFQGALDRTFGKDDLLVTHCYKISRLVQYHEPEAGKSSDAGVERRSDGCQTSGETLGADDYKMMLLVEIDARVRLLKRSIEDVGQAEAREQQATLLTHNLPSVEFVEKLIRYETLLEKKKHNAIKLLLKLQGKEK